MKYFLDFDRVLFDHDSLRQAMQRKNLEDLYAEPGLWDEISPADFLYPDTLQFLARLPRTEVAVVSAYTARIGSNAKAYQDRKLKDSGIAELVGEVVAVDGPKAPFIAARVAGTGFFIDDKRTYVEEVALACPEVTCIQLLRPNAERTSFDATNHPELDIPVVKNLAEAAKLMGI